MTNLGLSRRGGICGAFAAATLTLIGPTRNGLAQGAPLRILSGASPGSIPDVIARRYAEQLAARLGRPVVVENRGGAAGRVAVGALRQAPADGSTLLLGAGAVASIYPYLFRELGYDPDADLRPVSVAAEATLGLAVGPAVPATVRGLNELRDWTRANPAVANFGSPGVGSLPHLLPAKLFAEAGVEATHVPYPGGPPAVADLLAGRIAVLALPEGLLREHHAAGRLRVLATSGAERSPFLPAVPSVAEQGFRGLVMGEWFGFFLPGGASPVLAESTAEAIRQAAADPALRAAFNTMAMTAVAGTPAAMRGRIAQERPAWQAFLAASGIRAD
ncbi:tripartite tricarboxylate transporter substrate-binding protein [Falsiroseomonas sp.]|uniref:tripartite tricarboxylate transporter substrate-binding protein n=1 Tax=Falsiroseomonas sp. TaxID=2870721 RepID=UPI002726B8EF|nr:tripartite tricarboxylate transporter substrate-binding protein [Falsiroseomonas sp.]MDO9501156.1 tripartite tricarboxylate transporter substrate-binding protein [Falsiroseomonas sp.]